METHKLIITPKTKVLHLIETYPELEDILIGYVPAFKKLKNPVLRKTVAKIATLQQAASIGSVRVEELINVLRKAVGQDLVAEADELNLNINRPDWFNENKITQELDATEMLSVGEHPVNQVISDLKNLPSESIYKLVAPFLPAPLIEKAESLGFRHWIQKKAEDKFFVYFCR